MAIYYRFIQHKRENPIFLLLHGFMGSGDDWLPLMDQLPRRWNYLLPDLPGHGKSKIRISRDTFSIPGMALQLKRLWGELSLSPGGILGYSMGGRLALALTHVMPEKVQFLILESTSPGIDVPEARKQRRLWDLEQAGLIRKLGMEEFVNQWYNQPLFRTLHTHPQFELLKSKRRHNSAYKLSMVMRYAGTGSMGDYRHVIRTFTRPALYICGELDKKYVQVAQELKHINPAVTMHIVQNAGHNVHFEQPRRYLEIVNEFLSSVKTDR